MAVYVTAANTGGSSPPVASAPTGAVINIIPANSTVPTISGTAQVGQTLTATTGTWTNNPTSFTYRWNRAGTAISGATVSSYVPVTADIGNTLTVSVTAANTGGFQPARDERADGRRHQYHSGEQHCANDCPVPRRSARR